MGGTCEESIAVNTDVGGPGVMASFLALAWFTVLVAFVAGSREIEMSYPFRKLPCFAFSSRVCDCATELLGPLTDLQATTGLSISIAGYAQLDGLSYYHLDVVSQYWWIVQTAFWSAQPAVTDPNSDLEPVGLLVRRLVVLASSVTGSVLQVRGIFIFRGDDPWRGCFAFKDPTQVEQYTWFWLAGVWIYCVAIIIIVFKQGWILATMNSLFDRGEIALKKRIRGLHDEPFKMRKSSSTVSAFLHHTWLLVSIPVYVVIYLIYFLFVRLIGLWSYGPEHATSHVLGFVGLQIWNTYDVVTESFVNTPFLGRDETFWGFGQVLPMIMMMQVVYSSIDIWRKKRF